MQAQVNHDKSKITENSLCSFNFFISMNYSFNFRPQKNNSARSRPAGIGNADLGQSGPMRLRVGRPCLVPLKFQKISNATVISNV